MAKRTKTTDGDRWYTERDFRLNETKVNRFHRRIQQLAEQTFGLGGDGACPVVTSVVDRTRYRNLCYWPVPYEGGLANAVFNLRIAFAEWSTNQCVAEREKK